ncbi:hypothetical protein [Actinoalloteichus caeruleus]|uniref:hypothetical protein n=1 Tax=Actinoalloteichus cyanogriseus TaxID=2893586 RepID=UPI003AB08F93
MTTPFGAGGARLAPVGAAVTNQVDQLRTSVASGSVHMEQRSAEAAAARLDDIADLVARMLRELRRVEQKVPLGSGPAAEWMSRHDELVASGGMDSARDILTTFQGLISDLATAVRAAVRHTQETDEAVESSLDTIRGGGDA